MAWPFSSVVAPNFDSGAGVAVPTSLTALTASQVWLLGAHFTNTSGAPIIVTVTDAAGAILCQLELPAAAEQPYEWPFRPALGVKWSAASAGVTGQVWGYV